MTETEDNHQQESLAERKMRERAERREQKKRKRMPVSGKEVFKLKEKIERGLTLIELMVVIGIVLILFSAIFFSIVRSREMVFFGRANKEVDTIVESIGLYYLDHDKTYPEDVDRDIPPGLEEYLGPGEWPQAPWPGSFYDYDYWSADALAYPPYEDIIQISIRFCPYGDSSSCKFPHQSWAKDFDYYSSAFYCLKGPCRSHSSRPVDHPGYCLNCN